MNQYIIFPVGIFIRFCLALSLFISCKTPGHVLQPNGTMQVLRFHSSHTSFPDTARANGHLYDNVMYDASAHYSDSSVMIVIPPSFSPGAHLNLVFWFHGWRNNIDSAEKRFQIGSQLIASNRNAILVLAETAKNAPDSYGGKLERPGGFDALVNDIMNELKTRKVIPEKANAGNITLAGHSGAYRVIAYILKNSGPKIQEVFLFDALYANVPEFMSWIKEDRKNEFVHWYTNKGGGTDEVSNDMMKQLQAQQIKFAQAEETTITAEQIKNNRVLFIHSLKEHNDIINNPDNFQFLLSALK